MTEAKSQNYWISPTALKITLNALSDADYIQASAASGAMIMCYMKGIEGLEYDHGHNYKRWPLRIAQTYFTTPTRKYVYVRIPRPAADPSAVDTDVAQVVFPSERIDLYGMTENGRQVGDDKYYYVYTQGIISASEPTAEGLRRRWEQDIVTGTLASDEATEAGGTGEWWRYDPFTDMVTFLKKIAYAVFEYLKADQAEVDELTAGNATVQKLLRAYNAYINRVQSTNYTGDGLLDTGWRITTEYEGGNSAATFDYLTVRKKAFFNELEIRKLSSIGGNFCMSPASGKIFRVEWFDGSGSMLGYDYYNVPWTVGGRLLGLFSKSLAQRFLGKRKRLARRLTPDDLAAMRTIRCYFYTDDGSTSTMLNWTVGAQARCQSFNIESQMEQYSGGETSNPDVGFYDSDYRGQEYRTETDQYGGTEFYRGHKVSNTYWWRLVTAVGKARLDDGKTHYFIEFMVNTGNDGVHRDAGSDLPSVGDQVVQMGHRTRTDQQNVIMIETASEDAPAIKMYDGINSWDLNGRLVARMSPKGWRVLSSKFEWLTAYGEQGVTINRGLWVDIPQVPSRTDFSIDMAPLVPARRCYYNDVVSHNGSYWRCIVNEGFHKENAEGYWFTQQEIDRMPVEDQMLLTDVANYTTVTPGDATHEQRAVWQVEVSIGISPYLVITPALMSVPCEKNGRATQAYSVSAAVRLMVTNLEAEITSVTMEGADGHVSLSGNYVSVNFPKGTVVPNKDYTVTVEGVCNSQRYTATDKISVYAVVKGNDAYEVTALPMNWLWNQTGANYTTEDIRRMIDEGTSPSDFPIEIDKVEVLPNGRLGNSCAQLSVVNGGVAQPFQIVGVVTSDSRVTASKNNVSGRVWVTACPNTLESGWVDVTVEYGAAVRHTLRIPFWCNLLGTWREIIFGDTRYAIAEKTRYLDDKYNQFHAEYEQSSQQASQQFSKITGIIGADGEKIVTQTEFGTYKQSASESYTELSRTVDGKVNTSTFNQTVYNINLSVEQAEDDAISAAGTNADNKIAANNALIKTRTGIDITAGKINLQADKVTFTNSAGTVSGKIYIGTEDGTLHAANAHLTGELIIQQNGNDGLKLSANGDILRWNKTQNRWMPIYAGRAVRYPQLGGVGVNGSKITVQQDDDCLMVVKRIGDNDVSEVNIPRDFKKGKVLTIRALPGAYFTVTSDSSFVLGGGVVSSFVLDEGRRAELIKAGAGDGETSGYWYTNIMGW